MLGGGQDGAPRLGRSGTPAGIARGDHVGRGESVRVRGQARCEHAPGRRARGQRAEQPVTHVGVEIDAAIGGKNIVAWAKDPNRDAAQKDAKAMNVQASRDQAGKRRPSLGNGDHPNRTRQPRTPQFCDSSSDACSVRRHPKPCGARGNRSLPSQRQRLVFPGPSNERRHFYCSIIRPQDAQHLSPVVIHVEPVLQIRLRVLPLNRVSIPW